MTFPIPLFVIVAVERSLSARKSFMANTNKNNSDSSSNGNSSSENTSGSSGDNKRGKSLLAAALMRASKIPGDLASQRRLGRTLMPPFEAAKPYLAPSESSNMDRLLALNQNFDCDVAVKHSLDWKKLVRAFNKPSNISHEEEMMLMLMTEF